MKKLLAAAVLAISAFGFTATANASGCEISAKGLTAEQVQKLRIQCEQEQLKRLEENAQASGLAPVRLLKRLSTSHRAKIVTGVLFY